MLLSLTMAIGFNSAAVLGDLRNIISTLPISINRLDATLPHNGYIGFNSATVLGDFKKHYFYLTYIYQ